MDSATKMIGVFGDSYADLNPAQYIDESAGRMPWPMWLEKISNTAVKSYGVSSTSAWYSYKVFLNEYKKYDTVVFCYSDLHRWHNINDEVGLHTGLYHVRAKDQLKFVPHEFQHKANVLVQAYEVLHDWDLDKFIFQSIFDSVNSLCDEFGIKVINILNFEEINGTALTIDVSKTRNTVLTNLVQVSGNEYTTPNGKPKDVQIYKFITENADKRFCHLSPFNNKALAEIVYNCMNNEVGYVNLGNDDRFSGDAEHLRYLLDLK
jgi:hypothetical protein